MPRERRIRVIGRFRLEWDEAAESDAPAQVSLFDRHAAPPPCYLLATGSDADRAGALLDLWTTLLAAGAPGAAVAYVVEAYDAHMDGTAAAPRRHDRMPVDAATTSPPAKDE